VLPGLSSALPVLSSALPVLSSALRGAPRCTWRALRRTSLLWDFTTLGFLSDNSQTLRDTPRDIITFCWHKQINPYLNHTFLVWGKWDLQFICPEWRGILSVRYMAKQLSCRILYIWLQLSILKSRVLSFAEIIKPLYIRWVYKRALSLPFGDMHLCVDNWLQISSYSYMVLPIAMVLQYELITLMT